MEREASHKLPSSLESAGADSWLKNFHSLSIIHLNTLTVLCRAEEPQAVCQLRHEIERQQA